MNTDRGCGCKAWRSCLLCETELGLPPNPAVTVRPRPASAVWNYCPEPDDCCNAETGERIEFPGLVLLQDWITGQEEAELVAGLDRLPWHTSQSGRRKQNFGPRANFKKRKAKVGAFAGFPAATRFIQQRFATVAGLEDYKTVEQCSIEYTPDTGAAIEPHIDDCWIWGERIVQLNLLSDAVLTLTPYSGDWGVQYNLGDVNYPRPNLPGRHPGGGASFTPGCSTSRLAREEGVVVRVPLPARSLLIMFGSARYEWEHSVQRSDITGRRLVLAYRELTPPFLPGGEWAGLGAEILQQAGRWW